MHTPQFREPTNRFYKFQYRAIAHVFQGKPDWLSKITPQDFIDKIYRAIGLLRKSFWKGDVPQITLYEYGPSRSARHRWTLLEERLSTCQHSTLRAVGTL
jgi:hypothetical protein